MSTEPECVFCRKGIVPNNFSILVHSQSGLTVWGFKIPSIISDRLSQLGGGIIEACKRFWHGNVKSFSPPSDSGRGICYRIWRGFLSAKNFGILAARINLRQRAQPHPQ